MNEGDKKPERKEFETPAEYYQEVFKLARRIGEKNSGKRNDFPPDYPIRAIEIKVGIDFSAFWFMTYGFNFDDLSNPEGSQFENPFHFTFSENRFSLAYREVVVSRAAKYFFDINQFKSVEELREALTPFIEKFNILLEHSGFSDKLVLP